MKAGPDLNDPIKRDFEVISTINELLFPLSQAEIDGILAYLREFWKRS